MIIYKITNILNDKVYIGQTQYPVEYRWKGHLRDCKYAKNNKFYNAIKKYGAENFKVEIIEDNIENETLLNEREVYWIKQYDSFNNGYNSTIGGDISPMKFIHIRKKVSDALKNREFTQEHKVHLSQALKGRKGCSHTEDFKKKISKLMKGKIVTDETRQKLKDASTGKIQSSETKQKRSNSMKGKKFTEEHKRNLSKSLKGRVISYSGKDNSRSKPVNQIDIHTNIIIQTFDSTGLAEIAMGRKRNNGLISKVCNSKMRTAYGYKWEYQIESHKKGSNE